MGLHAREFRGLSLSTHVSVPFVVCAMGVQEGQWVLVYSTWDTAAAVVVVWQSGLFCGVLV